MDVKFYFVLKSGEISLKSEIFVPEEKNQKQPNPS